MNEKIILKAFDSSTDQIIDNYARIGTYGELYVVKFSRSAYSNESVPDLELRRYTGIKDVNREHIFEGNIVQDTLSKKQYIIMFGYCASLNFTGWYAQDVKSGKRLPFNADSDSDSNCNVVIIGDSMEKLYI